MWLGMNTWGLLNWLALLSSGVLVIGFGRDLLKSWFMKKRGHQALPCPHCGGREYQLKSAKWVVDSCSPLGLWRGVIECPCGNKLDTYLPFDEFPVKAKVADIQVALFDLFCTTSTSENQVMNDKKWEEVGTDEWVYETEFGCLQVDRGEGYAEYETEDVTGKFRAYWNWEDAEDLGWFDTIEDGKIACIADYDAKVAKIALANGYVKIEADDVMGARILDLGAKLEAAEDEIDRWKIASGLECGDDPDHVTPEAAQEYWEKVERGDPTKVTISHGTARKLAVTVLKDHGIASPEDRVLWDDASVRRAYDEVREAIKRADMTLTAAIGMPVGGSEDA